MLRSCYHAAFSHPALASHFPLACLGAPGLLCFMSAAPPRLPENAALAFLGEVAWMPARLTASEAKIISTTRNPTGRPNRDVLRTFVGQTGRRIHKQWQIDFPAHYREPEAALHESPFALLQKKISAANASPVGASLPVRRAQGPEPVVGLATQDTRSREQARSHKSETETTAPSVSWWHNPHAQPSLRHALARLDRFLATALNDSEPTWTWFESDHLPDDSLLIVARDDDFTHAVLESAAFISWWRAYVQKIAPTQIVESFPFPWSPFTPLGSLTKAQQEIRSAATRAVLAGDTEQLNSTIAAAFGWKNNWDESEILPALNELHRQRICG